MAAKQGQPVRQRIGVTVRTLREARGPALWIATSGTDRQAGYVVSLHECECPGHASHGYCKHRALLAWTLRALTFGSPDPEPPTPAAPAGRRPFNLSDGEMVAAKADAMKRFPLYGAPLISVETGEVIAEAA